MNLTLLRLSVTSNNTSQPSITNSTSFSKTWHHSTGQKSKPKKRKRKINWNDIPESSELSVREETQRKQKQKKKMKDELGKRKRQQLKNWEVETDRSRTEMNLRVEKTESGSSERKADLTAAMTRAKESRSPAVWAATGGGSHAL